MSDILNRKTVLIFMLGFLSAAVFISFCGPLSGFDAIQYDRLGFNVASGRGFSLSETAPYLPTMFREPGYPSFLALIYMIFGHSIMPVVLIQALLHALTALITLVVADSVFSQRTALLSGICVAVFPTQANFAAYLMSETFFTFLLSACVLIFLRAVKSGRLWIFAAAGVSLGALALTKLTALFFPVIMIAALTLTKDAIDMKKLIAGITVMLLIFVIIVSAWSIRNKAVFNTYSLSLRGSDVMWSRAQKVDNSLGEIAATALCSVSEYAGGKIFPEIVKSPDRYLYKDLDRVVEIQNEYKKNGMSIEAIDDMLKKEAMAKISRHPVKYLAYTFIESIKMTAFTFLPMFNEERVRTYMKSHRISGLALSVLKGCMRMLAYPVLLLAIIGMASNCRAWRSWAVIASPVFYFNVMYSLMDAIGRYGVPLIPFYCIFAAAALCRPRYRSA